MENTGADLLGIGGKVWLQPRSIYLCCFIVFWLGWSTDVMMATPLVSVVLRIHQLKENCGDPATQYFYCVRVDSWFWSTSNSFSGSRRFAINKTGQSKAARPVKRIRWHRRSWVRRLKLFKFGECDGSTDPSNNTSACYWDYSGCGPMTSYLHQCWEG